MCLRFTLSLALLGMVSSLFAQDVQSGPPKGKKVPALKVYDVTGPNQGKTLDYAKERKGNPTIYVFIPTEKWTRPVHRFVKELGDKVQNKIDKGMVIAVWLTDDKEKTKQYLPRIANYYQATALTYFPGKKAGPADWTINDQADVTVVVTRKGQVLASLGYNSINETVVREVLKKFAKSKKK